MADLHNALKYLAPVEWSDVPRDNLESYLSSAFDAGELIANSVPPLQNGTPFHTSKPHHQTPNSATSHKEIHPSAARSQPPHKDHEDLQRLWGKPQKFSEKDNPLHIAVYKTAGNDRHGSWFARRSVHEGLGFDKFKKAMMREFASSMAVVGGPGAGCVRGLAADRRLEQIDVKDTGRLEVYELSAQFPGPVSARDFVTLLMTSDDVLTDKSAAELEGGKRHVPRHFMIVSKPIDHPDAPERPGYVRAQYESVELIREIPLSTAGTKSTPNLLSQTTDAPKNRDRGATVGFAESRGPNAKGEALDTHDHSAGSAEHDPELNPVEWIMVTRSDPGGGIPRFLVDRGTPETMLTDVHKFFNWACSQGEIPGPDEDVKSQEIASTEAEAVKNGETKPAVAATSGAAQDTHLAAPQRTVTAPASTTVDQQNGGIMSQLTQALGAGIDAYAPASVAAMMHQRAQPVEAEDDSSDDSSDVSSINSFESASEMRHGPAAAGGISGSTDNLSLRSTESDIAGRANQKGMTRHEKDLQKLIRKREKLDRELTKKRESEEAKLRQSQEKNESEATKQREKIQKELKKTEEKHKRDIEKIEKKKEREARKIEEKRQKKDDQNKMSLVTRERDEFRSQVGLFRKENHLLREQIGDLEALNTALANQLSKIGGPEALKSVQDEVGRDRASSLKSMEGRVSGEAAGSSIEKKAEATP